MLINFWYRLEVEAISGRSSLSISCRLWDEIVIFRGLASLVGRSRALKWVNRCESLAAAAPDGLSYDIPSVIGAVRV